MKVYYLKKDQVIKTTLEEAWNFFSSPKNLAKITPDYMNFTMVDNGKDEPIYEGMIIRYKVRPLFNIPINWITEITHIIDRKRFIDEQRFGPYKFWHHQHHFKPHKNGVFIEDIVHYALGYSFLGRLANHLLVRKKLEDIFEYRSQIIKKIFK